MLDLRKINSPNLQGQSVYEQEEDPISMGPGLGGAPVLVDTRSHLKATNPLPASLSRSDGLIQVIKPEDKFVINPEQINRARLAAVDYISSFWR